MRAERNRLASAKFLDVTRSPAHQPWAPIRARARAPAIAVVTGSRVGSVPESLRAYSCKLLIQQMVAGGRYELYSNYSLKIQAVAASVVPAA
jgi:hypothetical protein